MGRRRKLFKLNLRSESFISVAATLLILLAILTFLSFFAQSAIGSFVIQETVNRFFGWGSILLPFILASAGLLLFRHRPRFINLNVLVGLVLLVVSFLGLTHLIFFRGADAYDLAILGQGGGLVGYYASRLTERYFSLPGAFFVFISFLIISVLIFFNTSVDRFLAVIGSSLRSLISLAKKMAGKRERGGKIKIEGSEKMLPELLSGQVRGEPKGEEDVKILPRPTEPARSGEDLERTSGREELASVRGEIRQETVKNETISQIWEYPPATLLSDSKVEGANRGDVAKNATTIEKTLDSFGIKARVVEINLGPAVTQYALESAQGTKIAKIKNLQNDLALSLASPTGTVRIEAPIPGKSLVGVEVPNLSPSLVTLKSIMVSEAMKASKSKLSVSLGLDVSGSSVVIDICRMPHILMAGSTGSGKSTLIHAFLATLLFRCSPEELRLILVDTKRVELTEYADIPHLLTPVITESEKVLAALKWSIGEMERRYKLFQNARVRDVDAYNDLSGFQALPYIVILVDELADMMQLAPVEAEKAVCRLAQMARATGIHLVLSTQRPSVDVLTGLIKANIPCRIAFNVTSQIDSRVIIDQMGAEKLLGRGDMLYLPPDSSKPLRIQGVYVHPSELHSLLDFIRSNNISPTYEEEVTAGATLKVSGATSEDELFDEAVRVICEYDRASASLLQRRLRIGYARAARLLDEMEGQGIVAGSDGSKPREVLIHTPPDLMGGNG